MTDRVRTKNLRQQNRRLLFILGLALALRLVYSLVIFPSLLKHSGTELGWIRNGQLAVDPYDTIARNILAGKGYVDDTGRVNFERPPLYTYFLVLAYKLWGVDLWKLQVVQALLDTLSCFLIYALAAKIFQDRRIPLLAAFLYAIYFKMINIISQPFSETLYIFLLLLFLWTFSASLQEDSLAFAAGLCLGLMTLAKPITLLYTLVAAGLYVYFRGKSTLRKILFFLIGVVILILPLLIRNYQLGGGFFLSTGGGRALCLGTVMDYSKNFREEELAEMKEINARSPFAYSIEADRKLRKIAIANIVRDPAGYGKRVAVRLCLFWFYPDFSTRMMTLKTVCVGLLNFALLVLAAVGFYLAKKEKLSYLIFFWTLLYFNFSYSLIYSHSRYSLPLFPILFMFSSYAIIRIWQKTQEKMATPSLTKNF